MVAPIAKITVTSAPRPARPAAVAERAAAPAPDPAPKPAPEKKGGGGLFGFLGRAVGAVATGVSGVVGGVIGVVGHVMDKTGDAIGAVSQGALRGAGWVVGAPFGAASWALDAVGAHGAAKALGAVRHGIGRVAEVAGRELNGFCTGAGEAFKGMADGMKFLVQHPVMAAKGLVTMVRHPSVALEGLKAMWHEAIAGGPGHAVGYMAANIGPMFLSGGASQGTVLGRIATSSRLATTPVGRAIAAVANKAAHVIQVAKNAARFDLGKTAEAIGNFGKPLPVAAKTGFVKQAFQAIKQAVAHPVATGKALAQKAETAVTGVPGRMKAWKASARDLAGRAKVAKQALGESGRPWGRRIVTAQKAMEKSGRTVAEARSLGNWQIVADKGNVALAREAVKDAAKAAWHHDFSGVTDGIGRTVDAVGSIRQVENAVNGIDKVATVVSDVMDPGGSIEEGLSQRLARTTDAAVSANQGFIVRQALRLNQAGVYQGDKVREERDRDHGALKVINPL